MHHASWLSLLPFLIVIPISIWTKQVQPGLFVALLLGSYLIDPSPLGGIQKAIHYVVDNLIKSNNIRIILFLYIFAGLIHLIKVSGGIKGFVTLISDKVKTKKSAMFLTWISTMATFSDPDFRIVTIAPIMQALQERLHMSKQRIGFVIEVTSNPIVALVPIATGFVGYMVTIIDSSLKHSGIHRAAYTTYVESIPFNFFSLVIVIIGLYYTFFMHQKEKAEGTDPQPGNPQPLSQGKNGQPLPQQASLNQGKSLKDAYGNPVKDVHGKSLEGSGKLVFQEEYSRHLDAPIHHDPGEEDSVKPRPWNLILPIATVLLLTLFLSYWNGHTKASSFFGAFIRSDALGVMLESLLITLIFTIILLIFQKLSIAKIVTSFVEGGNQLMSVIILLALIWAVSAVSEDLGFSIYITNHVKGWIPPMLVAPILFLLGAVISYFIGSSWGTWGLLMPLGVMLAHHSGSHLLLVIGAVFASGTFGAFASPLSDNTVTLCTIMKLDIMPYARSKLIPACIAAGITALLFTGASFVI